ncbi:MAG: lipid-A-disaccharide synthase [Pyrinomonadaceae bacterium MAG19_C2-C3]|nr:lipid-A-disaccharide synthase [Pyrinomonadaceae bacterium MAG19_C2-C3]
MHGVNDFPRSIFGAAAMLSRAAAKTEAATYFLLPRYYSPVSIEATAKLNSARLMIVAGEASGFSHAARLVEALRHHAPETAFEFFGATGKPMRDAGVETIAQMDDMARVGIVEVGRVFHRYWRIYQQLQNIAAMRRPDACILVDFPEFNLRLARKLHRQGLKVIYYISPQLWAWRKRRVRIVRDDVDLLLSILPFEVEWYARHDVHHVNYTGNPLTGEVHRTLTPEEFCLKHNLQFFHPIISLLPGSRRQELTRHLPLMIQAAEALLDTHPNAQFIVALAPNRDTSELASQLKLHPTLAARFRFVHGETYDALAASDAAAVASGTATLEAAIIGTPLVVVYRESALNWHTLGRLIDVEHFGLVNLVAGKRLAPELIQHDFTPERTARELALLLKPSHNAHTRAQLRAAVVRLGSGRASERAAEIIIGHLRMWKLGGNRRVE